MGGFEYLYNQYLYIDRRKVFFNSKTLLLNFYWIKCLSTLERLILIKNQEMKKVYSDANVFVP